MNATPAPARPRSVGRIIVAVLFVALCLSAWQQVIDDLRGHGEPPTITVLQTIIGALAAATAWGAWTGARWSAVLAALYGVVTGGMIVALGPLLDMPADARGGLWTGGAAVLLVSLACAWYLRRATRSTSVDAPHERESA